MILLKEGEIMSEMEQLPKYLRDLVSEEIDSGCWTWKGKRRGDGYGVISALAHRLVYSIIRGAISDGLVLDHLCRNHGCVNPAHLDAVTNAENVLRGKGWAGIHFKKTHCPKGHPFNEENTYVYPSKNGKPGRLCIACRNAAKKRHYHSTKPPLKPKPGPRTHCKKGHELSAENVYRWTNPKGKTLVYCIKCREANRPRRRGA